MDSAVSIEAAVVTHRRQRILSEVCLRVAERELLGIFGPNGAGKTTLLRMIEGLVPLASGTARVIGREVHPSNLRWIRTFTAYVPQSLRVDPRMPISVRDVVLMGRYGRMGLLIPPKPEDFQAVNRALTQVGAEHLVSRPFGQLSGGEQQRVAIARAIAQAPRLMLLDEPTTSLDWESQHKVRDLIRTVHDDNGLTTIVVSHDVDFLARLCDRIVLMENGRIVDEHDPESFTHCCRRQVESSSAGVESEAGS